MSKVVFFQADGQITPVDVNVGTTVMQAGKQAGVEQMIAECGGGLNCATCHVYVDQTWIDRLPPPSGDEADLLEVANEPGSTSRLSCQIVMTSDLDGLTVRMPASQF